MEGYIIFVELDATEFQAKPEFDIQKLLPENSQLPCLSTNPRVSRR